MDALPFNHVGFEHAIDNGQLAAARCLDCGALALPPRPLCARCGGSRLEWQILSGEGEILAFTWIHVGLPALVGEGYDRSNPYCSAVIRLREGPGIAALVLAAADRDQIRIGLPVRAAYIERGAGGRKRMTLAFEPV